MSSRDEDWPDADAGVSGRQRQPGRRKDGKPYKEGNTREDGSYLVGKCRPDTKHQFKVGDGRKRGKREKGSKNVSTIWRKQLRRKITLDGKTQTALEWVIEGTIRRGITSSDRASETAIGRAESLERSSEDKLGLSEQEVIDAWLARRLTELMGEVTDDLNAADAEPGKGGDDADQ